MEYIGLAEYPVISKKSVRLKESSMEIYVSKTEEALYKTNRGYFLETEDGSVISEISATSAEHWLATNKIVHNEVGTHPSEIPSETAAWEIERRQKRWNHNNNKALHKRV